MPTETSWSQRLDTHQAVIRDWLLLPDATLLLRGDFCPMR